MTAPVRPIRNNEDYNSALVRIDALWGSPEGSPEGDTLDILLTLVEAYEAKHHEIPAGDPIEVIDYKRKELGLSQNELAHQLGWTSGRVSEVLRRKRPLTLSMIRSLAEVLGISPGILVGEEKAVASSQSPIYLPASIINKVRTQLQSPAEGLEEGFIRILERGLAGPERRNAPRAAPPVVEPANSVGCFRLSSSVSLDHQKIAA